MTILSIQGPYSNPMKQPSYTSLLTDFKETTMGRVFFGLAALFFFFEAANVHIMPHPTAWGFVSLALGLAVGGWIPWKRSS